MNVPSEPKTYTTTYDSFKGVDFTNDASNVFRRRSPTGKNMLPTLDGRPYKRTGWKIEKTSADFCTAAGVSTNTVVIPQKTYYFELGGKDYLMIFNSLGVFSYVEGTLTYLATYYDGGLVTKAFPPTGETIDPSRAFFFEGGATVGFYIFAGRKLFRYDGNLVGMSDAYLELVEPKIPKVLLGCDATGAGTMYESINLLTDKRTVGYNLPVGNNQTVTLPGGVTAADETVKVRNSSGTWVTASHTVGTGTITLTQGPGIADGEDNVEITYAPADVANPTTVSKTTSVAIIAYSKRTTQERRRTDSGAISGWGTTGVEYASKSKAKLAVTNLKVSAGFVADIYNEQTSSWLLNKTSEVNITTDAYNSSITVEAKKSLIQNYPSAAKKQTITTTYNWVRKNSSEWVQKQTIEERYNYEVRVNYTSLLYHASDMSDTVNAFVSCQRAYIFGSGIINQVFMSTVAPEYNAYNTRIWYSKATDPTYFPDTNYIEVGATDKPVMGMMTVGEYLGVIKSGSNLGTSIYLAYPTTFDDDTTYAVKRSTNGIGAVSSGAFNTLNNEPLFLSVEGVMGIDITEAEEDRNVRNRSYYVNRKLCAEDSLATAISFVHRNMYYLCVNNRCYVLDGSQKNSWENTKTNLQYECYYLENIPAQCFAKYEGHLWFSDMSGNLCRFKDENEEEAYKDDYSVGVPRWTATSAPVGGEISVSDLDGEGNELAYLTDENYNYLTDENGNRLIAVIGFPSVGETVQYGKKWYTISNVEGDTVSLIDGVAIEAEWSTIADDDGAVHFFKNLKKKGTLISLLPASNSGVEVYVKADSKDPMFAGITDAKDYELPSEFYAKKKIKKYKRLQFICRNNVINDSFGIDQIIKTYTMGNYSKNKR